LRRTRTARRNACGDCGSYRHEPHEVNLVLVFKILLPDPGWRLALTAGPDEGTADGMDLPNSGSPIRGLLHIEGEAIPAENR